MKHHKYLIGLIVLTAALVTAGVFAFKYMRTYDHIEQGYPEDLSSEMTESQNNIDVDADSENDIDNALEETLPEDQTVVIQKCTATGTACSDSLRCCRPDTCVNGRCRTL